MAEAVVAEAIIGISNWLIQEAQFLGAVTGKVEQLQTEMNLIQCYLKDADKKQNESEGVRGWVSELRELAYEAEDVVADFIAKVALRKEKGLLRQLKRYATIFVENANLYKVGVDIDAIIAKIANLRQSSETYGFKINDQGEASTSHRLQQFRKTYAHTVEENTVGLVKDVEILLQKLVGQPKRHQVVSICGMGGLGKSTLAKKLYNHDAVKGHYNAFAWVFVSQQFQVQQILGEILSQLSSSDLKSILNKSADEIAAELYDLQKSKNCLVIIDDLWTKEDWNALKPAFPIGHIQGMIVLTTRIKALGSQVDRNSFNHGPSMLSDDESWQLFQMKAFGEEAHTDIPDLDMKKELGEKMVKMCSGLPLAIVVLGGVLATKRSLKEWELAATSFGMFLQTEKKDSNEYYTVNAVLALSYLELPYHLKPCFLSLARFPEDYSICTKMLFRLWMAEGIVTNQINDKDTPEDIAERYLLQLVDRCIVQIGEIGSTGRIKTCRLHDLIRDLSLSKAKQENFLEIINSTTENSNARRVIVDVSDNRYIDDISLKENRWIRSLTLPRSVLQLLKVSEFKMLRVLVLNRCRIPKKNIIEIGKLIHLKYLRIETMSDSVDEVPSSLGNLRYLQTFIFISSAEKLKISKKIWNLQELRYLHIQWCMGPSSTKGEAELNVGNLKNLRTLRTWGPITVEGLENLTNLKKLEIALCTWGPITVEGLENLTNLKKLEIALYAVEGFSKVLNGLATLYLDNYSYHGARRLSELSEERVHELFKGCGELQKLKLLGKIEKLPKYQQNFTPNLTKLTLIESRLKEDPMPFLEKLPKLTFLKLYSAFEGEVMVCSSFPQLKTLFLIDLSHLVNWRVDEGSLAKLSHLSITFCPKLAMVPKGIRFIKTLSRFEIHSMPEEFNNRVKGDDFYKVAHVSSVVFHN